MADITESNRVIHEESLSPAEMLDKFKLDIVNDADDSDDQRDRANAAMRFINVPGGQWEDFLDDQFGKRTKLEVDQVSEVVNKFIGEWNESRVGVEFKASDAKTSDDEADLLNKIYRANYRDERGKEAVDNAVDEAATCGYGCYKLGTRFLDDTDPQNEQQMIEFRPLYNAYRSVFWDKSSESIMKREARRCTVLESFTPSALKEVYGEDVEAVSAYTPDTRPYNDYSKSKPDFIYIATRYEVKRKKVLTHIYSNLATNEIESYSDKDHKLVEKELSESPVHNKIRERKIVEQWVEKSVFSGERFLEKPKRIAGKYIPIIPIFGYRSLVDGTERYYGLVQKLMDLQRLLNMQMSQLAENSASSGQDVPIFDPMQMPDAIAKLWVDRNNKPFMLAKSLVDQDGNIVQHGPLGYLKPPQLDGSTAALLTIVPELFRQMTGGAPKDTLDPDTSGKAIAKLIKRENLKTQTIRDNIANAVEWGGTVWQAMAKDVYNESRTMQTMGIDGSTGTVQLFREMQDEKTGRIIKANTLSGNFRAYSDVGPAYETEREQLVEDIKGMMELLISAGGAGAKYLPILMALMLENMQGVGMAGFKKIVRKDLILQGVEQPETDEEKQLMAQAQQQAQEPDAQTKAMDAMANQANAEAQKFISESRNLDSKSMDNVAASRKKLAETRKILAEIGHDETKTFNTVLNDAFKRNEQRAKRLPFDAGVGQ